MQKEAWWSTYILHHRLYVQPAVPGCRTRGLVLEHEPGPAGAGGMQQGPEEGGRWLRVTSPQGKPQRLPAKEQRALPQATSLPDRFWGWAPHPQAKWKTGTYLPKWHGLWRNIGALDSENSDARDACLFFPNTQSPSSLGHGSPSTLRDHFPPILLRIPLCPFLSRPLSPSDSSSPSLRLPVEPHSLGVVHESLGREA